MKPDWLTNLLRDDDDPELFDAYLAFAADVAACITAPRTAARLTALLSAAFWDERANADAWPRFYALLDRAMEAAELKVSTLSAFCRLRAFRLDNSDLAESAEG